MLRHYSKNSVKKTVRFTATTDALVQELRNALARKYPLLAGAGKTVSYAMCLERAVSAYMEQMGQDEHALQCEVEWFKTHGYFKHPVPEDSQTLADECP